MMASNLQFSDMIFFPQRLFIWLCFVLTFTSTSYGQTISCKTALLEQSAHSDYFYRLVSETGIGAFGKKIRKANDAYNFNKSGNVVFFSAEELDMIAFHSIQFIEHLTAAQLSALISIFRSSSHRLKGRYDLPVDFAEAWDDEVTQRWIDEVHGISNVEQPFLFSPAASLRAANARSFFTGNYIGEIFVQSLVDVLSLRNESGYLRVSDFSQRNVKSLSKILNLHRIVSKSDEFENEIAMALGYSQGAAISSIAGYEDPSVDAASSIPRLSERALENFEFEDDGLGLRDGEWYPEDEFVKRQGF